MGAIFGVRVSTKNPNFFSRHKIKCSMPSVDHPIVDLVFIGIKSRAPSSIQFVKFESIGADSALHGILDKHGIDLFLVENQ